MSELHGITYERCTMDDLREFDLYVFFDPEFYLAISLDAFRQRCYQGSGVWIYGIGKPSYELTKTSQCWRIAFPRTPDPETVNVLEEVTKNIHLHEGSLDYLDDDDKSGKRLFDIRTTIGGARRLLELLNRLKGA